MQSLYYLAVGSTIMILDVVADEPISLDQLFDPTLLHMSNSQGWRILFAYLVGMGAGAALMYAVVERAKKCADFASTIHILHCVFCMAHNGGAFPSQASWWVINIFSGALIAVVGEYLCMTKEMEDIPRGNSVVAV